MSASAPDGGASAPGDVLGLPKLVIRYPTEEAAAAALLPPGFDPCGDPTVQVNFYCAPVHGEPELGVSTRVPAAVDGRPGAYCLGIGIDQESAVFISRDTNGQPKFPCAVRYVRMGAEVLAAATHQGTTFAEYRGTSAGVVEADDPVEETEWWIKASPAVGGGPGFDLPPRVVQVTTAGRRVRVESLVGDLQLRDSDWDPYTTLLAPTGPATAELVTTRVTGRTIEPGPLLDADAVAPWLDNIGGSRWPGRRGAPRRPPAAPGGAT